jgi:hypothetical protein
MSRSASASLRQLGQGHTGRTEATGQRPTFCPGPGVRPLYVAIQELEIVVADILRMGLREYLRTGH